VEISDYETQLSAQEASMLRRTNIIRAIVVIAVLVATWAILGTAVAQKAAVPKPQDKLALGENEIKQLLLLIDTDKNGKISKQEWMKFVEAEFDRLDKDKKGHLDVEELAQSKLRVSHPVNVGK
jgi:CRISPR/Cas system-associated endonuclease Cas3-HD